MKLKLKLNFDFLAASVSLKIPDSENSSGLGIPLAHGMHPGFPRDFLQKVYVKKCVEDTYGGLPHLEHCSLFSTFMTAMLRINELFVSIEIVLLYEQQHKA